MYLTTNQYSSWEIVINWQALCHYKKEIRLSDGDVLNSSNNASIERGIVQNLTFIYTKFVVSNHKNGDGFSMLSKRSP